MPAKKSSAVKSKKPVSLSATKKPVTKKPVSVVQKKKVPSPPKPTPKKLEAARPKTPTLVRGMKDIQPKEGHLWLEMMMLARSITQAYGFSYTETPLVEEAALFVRSLGKGTDVVDKEMYVFEDRDGSRLALRPEWTASAVRSFITHGMHSQPQPVKMWTLGSMFRHDRPQAGRYRQFHQFDCETIGVRDPAVDAELISVAYNYLKDLGIKPVVKMNSIGSFADRERYTVELVAYLRSKRALLSEESKLRINKNPLRVLDSKDEQDRAVIEDAPQIVDWLSEDAKKYFMTVLEYLDEMDISYVLDPTLVRGLDYYSDTVFEIIEDEAQQGSSLSLGAGGRYDYLVEQLGGHPTPACGFAIGLERLILIKRRLLDGRPPEPTGPRVFFAHLGEQARRRALKLIEDLRRQGIIVEHNIAKTALKAQLEQANSVGSTHAIILGQKELQDGTVIIRDMSSGIQEMISQQKIKREIDRIEGKQVKK